MTGLLLLQAPLWWLLGSWIVEEIEESRKERASYKHSSQHVDDEAKDHRRPISTGGVSRHRRERFVWMRRLRTAS